MGWMLFLSLAYINLIGLASRAFKLNQRKCYPMQKDESRPAASPHGMTRERVGEIARSAIHHREQLEAILQRLCEHFGTTADEETLEREWLIGVVYNGDSIAEFYDKLDDLHRRESAAIDDVGTGSAA